MYSNVDIRQVALPFSLYYARMRRSRHVQLVGLHMVMHRRRALQPTVPAGLTLLGVGDLLQLLDGDSGTMQRQSTVKVLR